MKRAAVAVSFWEALVGISQLAVCLARLLLAVCLARLLLLALSRLMPWLRQCSTTAPCRGL